nr:YbaY family lipoprotein [Rhizobium sullae]
MSPFPGSASDLRISGEAFYRERILLPDDATLVVGLLELSGSSVLGATTVSPSGQVPISFTLSVASDQVPAGRNHGLRARIVADGKIWFTSDVLLPLDPRNEEKQPSLLLVRHHDGPDSSTSAALPLGTTSATPRPNTSLTRRGFVAGTGASLATMAALGFPHVFFAAPMALTGIKSASNPAVT